MISNDPYGILMIFYINNVNRLQISRRKENPTAGMRRSVDTSRQRVSRLSSISQENVITEDDENIRCVFPMLRHYSLLASRFGPMKKDAHKKTSMSNKTIQTTRTSRGSEHNVRVAIELNSPSNKSLEFSRCVDQFYLRLKIWFFHSTNTRRLPS